MAFVQMIFNLIKQRSIFQNMEGAYYVGGLYLVSWLLSKLRVSRLIRFLIAYLVSFTVLSIPMFFDGSYVNYTSFVVTGFGAIFIALMILVVIFGLNRRSGEDDK